MQIPGIVPHWTLCGLLTNHPCRTIITIRPFVIWFSKIQFKVLQPIFRSRPPNGNNGHSYRMDQGNKRKCNFNLYTEENMIVIHLYTWICFTQSHTNIVKLDIWLSAQFVSWLVTAVAKLLPQVIHPNPVDISVYRFHSHSERRRQPTSIPII